MTSFQLDQCLNNRRLAENCNAEGMTEVWRFPSHLARRPTADPEVLARFMTSDRVFLTSDGRLPWEHTRHIPDSHPGILIVRNDALHTLRIDDVARMLFNVKSQLPDWNQLSLSNSIIELWPDRIDVYHVESGSLQHDIHLSFADVDWISKLKAHLATNANLP